MHPFKNLTKTRTFNFEHTTKKLGPFNQQNPNPITALSLVNPTPFRSVCFCSVKKENKVEGLHNKDFVSLSYQINKFGNGQEEYHLRCLLITKTLFGQFLHQDIKINDEEDGIFKIGTELNDTVLQKITDANVQRLQISVTNPINKGGYLLTTILNDKKT